MSHIKKSQEISTQTHLSELRALLPLDSEADVYRIEEETGLSGQQWAAVRMLVQGRRQNEIADELGIAAETVSRWRSNPTFIAALNQSYRDTYNATVGEVREAAHDALSTLRDLMQSEDEKIRLNASLAILRLHLQLDARVLALPVTPADVARKRAELIKFYEVTDTMLI